MDFLVWLLSYILPFLAVLTIIVFVHEMGHYLVARWNDVAVDTFSIGFGREIVGWTDRAGTRWRISMIPLGGYVRFVGDMNAASAPDPEAINKIPEEEAGRLFHKKSVWRRIAVVGAGPLANVLFTFLVLYALLLGYGRYTLPAVIDEVVEDGVAAEAGIMPGDRMVSVDGYEVRGFDDFRRLVSTSPERPVTVVVDRLGQVQTLTMTPQATEITDRFGNTHRVGQIGVIAQIEPGDYTLYKPGPLEAVWMTFEEIRFLIDRTAAFLGDFFFGRGDLEQIGGPVKVAKVSGEVATLGFLALINLTALLSLNIGIFNLLPIPVLDGGHLLFYFIEAARGKPLSMRVQEIGFRLGMFIVLSLTVFTLINDVF
jgi:regulator of sigma E protease